jgi:predicted RNase H-like nuclease
LDKMIGGNKMSDYILTYTKTKFYPLEPVQSDIHIEDIAHALSFMTRANGHCKHFYSVAQHSINCGKEAKSRGYSERVQLGCLLHDANESYISDLTRPVKHNLSEYFVIEEKLQSTIYARFGLGDLSEDEQAQIKDVDDALLHFEFAALMECQIYDPPPFKVMEHDFSQRDFMSVEKEFMTNFFRLTHIQTGGFTCVGIDGCKGGWLTVSITDKSFEIAIYKNIVEVCTKYEGCDSLIIDMPIGLPESCKDIRPDAAARMVLKGKSSSIFNTPCMQAVYEDTYSKANELNRHIMGKGLSQQSFAICGKIKEIDKFLSNNPHYKNRLLESHPELCFATLNSGAPLLENKKTLEGTIKRIELLRRYYDKTEELIAVASGDQKLKKFMDDVVDALCLAVTGMVGLENGLKRIPENPMLDRAGMLMQMVYVKGGIEIL